jgi:hypothetical protein
VAARRADSDTRTPRLLAWQAITAGGLVVGAAATGIGSPRGIAFGAAFLATSFVLQLWATSAALGRSRRPGLAVLLFSLKLGLLLLLATAGLAVLEIPPMSFAVGATTLLVAIVVETCYTTRSARRGAAG